MYDFLDRPVGALNVGARLLVWSMRQWVKSSLAGRCACTKVGPAFHHWGLLAGLPHFQLMMVTLARGAREKMTFCDPVCMNIDESEALILGLFCTLREQGEEGFCKIATLIVHDTALVPLHLAVTALGRALDGREIYPERPQIDAAPSSIRDGRGASG
jgi:hypothetical protein